MYIIGCTALFYQKLKLVALCIKVIPLKLFYYQTFFETWHS